MKNNWMDNHLKFVLANILNKKVSEITKDFLITLRELDLSDCGISNLRGLEYATNITNINLSRNDIVDASLLSNLHRLTNLELSENRIEDISFLNSLKKLRSVGLDSNNISSIYNLKSLKKLVLLNVSNNKIKDLSFIDTLPSENVKIIASEQFILLKPINIYYGDSYTFKSPVYWNKETIVLLDNIQISGNYNSIKTNKRASILYSISKLLIKEIYSDCLLKADFYHEVPFLKSGILSGVLLQPIKVKYTKDSLDIFRNNKNDNGIIYGRLEINDFNGNKIKNEIDLKSKVITVINSNGDKISCFTNSNGEYKFCNLKKERYTVLFPFLDKYKYITPSLHVCNLNESESVEINSTVIKN
ncbi:MAG: leucine-rich repeat domain-containing protein [Romboutsia sp.]|uniref:leucine-rich repeat domain-containing protein n=1 Tax=Romboutsia sp. TaxID=1965302 RepID=UPI003F35D2E9